MPKLVLDLHSLHKEKQIQRISWVTLYTSPWSEDTTQIPHHCIILLTYLCFTRYWLTSCKHNKKEQNINPQNRDELLLLVTTFIFKEQKKNYNKVCLELLWWRFCIFERCELEQKEHGSIDICYYIFSIPIEIGVDGSRQDLANQKYRTIILSFTRSPIFNFWDRHRGEINSEDYTYYIYVGIARDG